MENLYTAKCPGRRTFPRMGKTPGLFYPAGGQYHVDAQERTRPIGPGTVTIAHRSEVHGVFNDGTEPVDFVSVLAASASGFEPH
jgi:mannose-6-phosphate isomerase-like protein (cupin superfamily)